MISVFLLKKNFIAALVGKREIRFTVDDKRAKRLKAQHSARKLLKRNGRPRLNKVFLRHFWDDVASRTVMSRDLCSAYFASRRSG